MAKSNLKGQTSEIIQFLRDGEKAIRISPVKDVVLVLGVTGSGKSTLSQFLTMNDEHLEAAEQGVDTGEFIIRDKGNKVCSTTTESCTTVPDLIIDRKTQTPFYDCPGFLDTRHVKHDLSVTYFIKKVIESADSVKLLFTVSYPAVRRGVDRQNFMSLVKNAVNMIKDIDQFKDSIALIVTKVDNQFIVKKGKAMMVGNGTIINNIASFLEEVKDNLIGKMSQNSLSPSEHVEMGKAVKFLEILLTKNGTGYERIGIFRRPDEAGKLTSPVMVENRESLEKIVHQNLEFAHCDTNDFGYTVSAESINRMHELVDQVNKRIGVDVEAIAKEIEEELLLQERDVSDVHDLYKKFNLGYEAIRNVTNVETLKDPNDFLSKIREAAGVLNVNVSKNTIDSILHYDRFLKFVHTLSGISTAKPLEWVEGLTKVVQSFDDSQSYYNFLMNLQTTLSKHDVQKELSKNSNVMDNLRNQIQSYDDEDLPVKDTLRQFLAQVYQDDVEKEYSSVKKAKLNSWKLKFLMNMLDFQVLTSCQDGKLVVFGNYVHLSDVAQKECKHAKFVEIFALSKVFIDGDFDRTGSKMQVSILAPTWDVIGSPAIVLDGKPAQEHRMAKASDGAWSGADGRDGLPGFPGGAAGNFLGFGLNCINCQFLTVSAIGGKGGAGQNGGDGVKGADGRRPERARDYKNVFNIGLVTVSHENKGNTGEKGGDGGRGGKGGIGGEKGKVSIFMFDAPNLPKSLELDGDSGAAGRGGNAGSGGVSEELVESNTYLFGLKAWSNGLISHGFFSALGGSTRDNLNDRGMISPEPPISVVNPSHAVNHYKAYLRENLGNSFSRLSLEGFLEQLETSGDVRALYDTLGLVNDLQCLESQYAKLHHRVALLPFYKSLLDKIDAYARDCPYSELSGEYRKVRAFLYMSTLSKICTIDNNLSNGLVINVKDFLGMIVKDVEELLKDYMVAKQRNGKRDKFQKLLSNQTEEAYKFIREDITLETQNILKELDGEIHSLIMETQRLQNITRKELKKLNQHMLSRAISTVVRVASSALDFFGVIGVAAEGIIGSTTVISEALALDGENSPLGNVFGSLPKIVDDFVSSISDHFLERVKTFTARLFDVDKVFRDSGDIPALQETRSVLSEAREEFSEASEMSEAPEEDWEKVSRKKTELVDFIQSQKNSIAKLLENDPDLEKALDVLHHSERILTVPDGVFSTLKKGRVEESEGDEYGHGLEGYEKLEQLESYESKIYSILVPLCMKLKQQFNQPDFDGKSHAALDVGKWKIQNVLSDINSEIMAMTQGFKVQGAMSATIEKLKFGISTMVQVYDRIQDYRDRASLADFMADMASSKAKAIQVTDRKLSDAIDDLQVILKTNLILADYEQAMNAFGQHVFPFAKAYMEEYDLPTSLKADNSSDLLSETIYKINSIERKMLKNELTINKHLDDYFFPDVEFGARNPFYVWPYETASREIFLLLLGKEITLHADVTRGLIHNAVKFNEIGLRFKLTNSASQIDFDERMGNFTIEMNHFGLSYYRCANKYYVMTHDSQKIAHSVNADEDGFFHYNSVYEKLSKNEPLLSPYTMWKLKLHNVSASFDVLTDYMSEIIDVALVGRGMYVSRDIDVSVCNDRLDQYYTVDETLNERPSIEYRIDNSIDDSVGDVEVKPRYSRSVENEVGNTGRGGFGMFSPLKKFVRWVIGGNAPTEETPNQLDASQPIEETPYQLDASQPTEETPFQSDGPQPEFIGMENAYDDPSFEYIRHADNSQSPAHQVNYGLLASQSNLLLLDLLMRSKTGAKRSFVPTNVDAMDNEYAQSIAYRAYAPRSHEEVNIVQ